jgi:MFS family permease
MQSEETAMLAGEELARELELESTEPTDDSHVRHLNLSQSLLYGVGGIAGGLVFTMMNNSLPLFLLAYTMPLGLPLFLNPGGPIPATIVALLTNERSLFGGLIQPIVGHWSDRTNSPLGKRGPYILAGGLGTALCITALAFHPPFWLMIAAVTLAGLFLFMALGPYSALLADITPYAQRGTIGSVIAIAGVVGALVFTVLSIYFDYGAVFIVTALLTAISLSVVAFGVREPRMHTEPHARSSPRATMGAILREKPLAIYIGAMTVYWLGAGAAAPFITRFAVKELGVSEKTSFVLLLVVVISTSVGAVIFGWLSDKIGRKRVLQPALVLFAVAALAGSQVQDMTSAIPVMILVGLGNAAPTALHLPLLADLVPRKRAGAFMGYANMVWSVAQPLGAFLAGMLVDFTDSYRGVFIMASICMTIAALIMTKVPNEPPDQ